MAYRTKVSLSLSPSFSPWFTLIESSMQNERLECNAIVMMVNIYVHKLYALGVQCSEWMCFIHHPESTELCGMNEFDNR